MFTRSVERTPERTALVNVVSDRRYTYTQLRDEVYSDANSLAELSISKGDRVAIAMMSSAEHIILNLAVQHLGPVAVPFNFRVSKENIRYHLSDSEAVAFAFDDALAEAVADDYQDLGVVFR
jgi:acyl-CoA synthetase (AMP-forming)/AMP-acid ligase II